jgi:predicted metal-dependent phosphoesterase TrpH
VVFAAAEKGLKAIAITDHDTMKGLPDAVQAGREAGVEVVPGVEISAEWDHGILHILGYFLDPGHPELVRTLDYLRQSREERIRRILDKLSGLKVNLSVEEVNEEAGGGVPGRPHIARALARKRYVSGLQDAFDRYLKKGAAAYVKKTKLSPKESLRLILAAGGLPVMAHPYSVVDDGTVALEDIVRDLVSCGLRGIEVYYPEHSGEQTKAFLELAGKFDLAVTGGTDFHGSNKPGVQLGVVPGQDPLPYSLLEELRRKAEWSRRPSSHGPPGKAQRPADVSGG